MYHGIREDRPQHGWDSFSRFNPSKDEFRRQIRYLARHYDPVGLGRVIGAINGENELPPRPILVTFDDAYSRLVPDCLPILREHRVPAVVFAIARALTREHLPWFVPFDRLLRRLRRPSFSWLGCSWDLTIAECLVSFTAAVKEEVYRRPSTEHLDVIADLGRAMGATSAEIDELCSWELDDDMQLMDAPALRQWVGADMMVGAHSSTHASMAHLRGPELADEVIGARQCLERLGFHVRSFAFPDGRFDAESVQLVGEHYELGFGVAVPNDRHSRFTIPRVPLGSDPPRELWMRLGAPSPGARWLEARFTGLLHRAGLRIAGWH